MKYGAGIAIIALVCAACGADSGGAQPAYPQPGYGYAYGAPPGYGSPPMYGYAPAPQGYPAPPQAYPAPPQGYPAPTGDPYAAARQRCVDETNAYRARVGAPPLVRRPDKEACSDADARGDAASGGVHGGAGGCGFGAQNECPGWPGPADRMLSGCLDSMFKEGPGEPYSEHGHYINMTDREYRGLACGFYQKGDGSVWLIQNYFR